MTSAAGSVEQIVTEFLGLLRSETAGPGEIGSEEEDSEHLAMARAAERLARLRPRDLQRLPGRLRAESERLSRCGAHREALLVRRLRCEAERRLSILRDMMV